MRKLTAILLLALAMVSCNAIQSIIHDDEVVAKVGSHKLYLSQLKAVLPEYTSPEDSVKFARQYIESWAADFLFEDMAASQLTKEEMDVESEIEDYRRSLLKYRYEQRYISDRLDTLVTEAQITDYYNAHTDVFKLTRPVLKVRYIDIMKESPVREQIEKLMSSSRREDIVLADSLATLHALRYIDLSDRWTDATALAIEFGIDCTAMLSMMRNSFIRLDEADKGDVKIAYVCDIRRDGLAPIEFCEPRIRDIILSSRKHALVEGLEQDLLTEALGRKHFVIY